MGCCNSRYEASRSLGSHSDLEVNTVSIQVVEGDIAVQTTDAIVNSTNATLTLDVGEAKMILETGGFRLKAECIEYVNQHGPLETAEVAVTSSGALPCAFIIHVVAPIYVNGRRGEPENLRKALITVLETAEKLNCQSIAIPAIATMPYSYPKPECASILIETTRTYLLSHSSTLKLVNFISTDKLTLRCFQKARDRIAREQYILASSDMNNL